jgi:flagellar FliL protein
MSDTKTDAPKKKGKMGKIIIAAAAVLLIGGGGAAAGMYVAHSGAKAEDHGPKLVPKEKQKRVAEGGEGKDEKATVGSAPPSGTGGEKYASNYYPMDKEFTSNLQDSVHLIQVGVAVSTPYDDSVIANLKTNDIAVRSAILMELGNTTEDQVFSADGKKGIQTRLVRAINGVLQAKEGFGGISNVYFTSFVVQ